MKVDNLYTELNSRLYLIGMMGAGKSMTGHLVATALNYSFADTDKIIEELGMSVAAIFEIKGEEQFREMERDALAAATQMSQTVVATGGGLPCYHDNLNVMLKDGVVIYLRASAKTLLKRLEVDSTVRPLLSDKPVTRAQEIKSLLQKRESYYERAHYIIDTDQDEVHVVAEKIARLVQGAKDQ